jgi:hypothetical protein
MASYTSGIPTTHTPPVKDGDYRIAVVNATERTSKAGNPMIELKHEILGPVGGSDFVEGGRPKVFDNLVFTANAAWKIDQFRAAIGEDVTEGEEVDVDADALIGATLTARIVLGKNDKGADRNEIGAYIIADEKGPF